MLQEHIPETFASLIIHKLNVACTIWVPRPPRGPSVKRQISGLQDHRSCNKKYVRYLNVVARKLASAQPADKACSGSTVRKRRAGYFGATAFSESSTCLYIFFSPTIVKEQ